MSSWHIASSQTRTNMFNSLTVLEVALYVDSGSWLLTMTGWEYQLCVDVSFNDCS